MTKLYEVLEFLERNIDLEHIDKAKKRTKDVLSYKSINERALLIFSLAGNQCFSSVPVADTHKDMSLLMYNQLMLSCEGVLVKDDRQFNLRADYGVGKLPSLFGAKSFFADKNQCPWCEHLPSKNDIRQIVEDGAPDLRLGFGQKVFDTYEYFSEQLAKYPIVEKAVNFCHPDLQGPFDVAHLLYGSDIYYDMYDEPELVHGLLSVVTDTFIEYMKKIKKNIKDEEDGFNFQWITLYRGSVLIRNDTLVTLSTDMYNEFVRPYDQRIIDAFGTASIHYCGQRQAWLSDMLTNTKGLKGINFGRVPVLEYDQSFLSEVYALAQLNDISILHYNVDTDYDIVKNGNKSGITYLAVAKNINDAKELLASLR